MVFLVQTWWISIFTRYNIISSSVSCKLYLQWGFFFLSALNEQGILLDFSYYKTWAINIIVSLFNGISWVWFELQSLAPSQRGELWIQWPSPGSFASPCLLSADILSASRFNGTRTLWSLGRSEPRALWPTSCTSWWLASVLAHYTRTCTRICPLHGSPVSLILHPHPRKWGTSGAEQEDAF